MGFCITIPTPKEKKLKIKKKIEEDETLCLATFVQASNYWTYSMWRFSKAQGKFLDN